MSQLFIRCCATCGHARLFGAPDSNRYRCTPLDVAGIVGVTMPCQGATYKLRPGLTESVWVDDWRPTVVQMEEYLTKCGLRPGAPDET